MIKAIYLDFDETLYSHKIEEIPASALEALNKAHDKGIKIFICTGRSLKEMLWFDLHNLMLDGIILNNGQLGVSSDKKTILFKRPISGELKRRCLKIFNEKKISTYLATLNDIYLNFENDAVRKTQSGFSSPVPRVKEYEGEDIYMISTFFDNEMDKQYVYDYLQEYAFITAWSEGALDIISKNSNKSSGIDDMNKVFGIDIGETMAFGDNFNDVDMLEHSGIGVAMGNSKKSALEAADYITSDIDEDGVYNALKHYKII